VTDLLDAVDALTKPTRTKVIRDDNTTVTVKHDALLVQLEDAVTSAIGNGGGGGSATGSVLNDEALYRLSLIRSQLSDWCRLVNVRPTRTDAVKDLRAWHVGFLGTNGEADFYTRALVGWAATIRELIDPPKRVPLRDPCPVCKASQWTGVDGGLRASPVAVEYDHGDPYRTVKAACRAEGCGAEWVGANAVEELIEEMGEADE
jgi:hypothetical protein